MLQRIYKNWCLNYVQNIVHHAGLFTSNNTCHFYDVQSNSVWITSHVLLQYWESTGDIIRLSLPWGWVSAEVHTSSIDSLLQCSFITKRIIPIQHLLLCFFSSFFLPVSLFLRAVYGSRPELLKALKSGAGTLQLGHVIVALPIFPKSPKLSELD